MVSCAVQTCKNHSNKLSLKNSGITYHMFPKDPHMKSRWAEATGNKADWRPSSTSTVCSIHFTGDCFNISKKNRRRLYEDAVPTIRLDSEVKTEIVYVHADNSHETNISLGLNGHDTPNERKLKMEVMHYKKIADERRKSIKRLTMRINRLKKRNSQMEELLIQVGTYE